jgi:hypothetical protein
VDISSGKESIMKKIRIWFANTIDFTNIYEGIVVLSKITMYEAIRSNVTAITLDTGNTIYVNMALKDFDDFVNSSFNV